eukprot:4111039-Heterocapsa_arctica.AAC.1
MDQDIDKARAAVARTALKMGKPDLEEARKDQLGKLYTVQTERYWAAHNRKRQTELIRQKIQELGL